MVVRAGRADDVQEVHRLIKALAAFEKAPEAVETTVEQLRRDFEDGCFQLMCCDAEEGRLAGFALYYHRYSTWTGRCLYLEDLFVEDEFRGRGLGTSLFEAVIKEAARLDCARMEWVCLDWNDGAIQFYREKFGAHIDSSWLQCKLVRPQLKSFLPSQNI